MGFHRGFLVLGVLATLALPAGAEDAPRPVRRHVIALMDGSGPDVFNTEDVVHDLLEMPLNHLGLVVRRHYTENGPPPEEWLEDAYAILTYFTASGRVEEWLWPWLERAAVGRRVLHFGEFGPLRQADEKRLQRWLARFGLAYDDTYIEGPLGVRTEFFRKEACCYEADPRLGSVHRGPRNASEENKAWVTTTWSQRPKDPRTPVVTGPWGGLALDPWPVRKGTDDQDRRWYIDPFLFLREALGLDRQIAPHPCVLNGRRMWILQVDGDGFESLSTVRPGEFAAKVMLDDVFLKYRLPYTVSIIVRSLTRDYAVEEPTKAMKLAQKMLGVPWIEAASHGVLHTLKWQTDLRPEHKPQTIMWYPSLENYEYNQVNEVSESIRFINERLLKDGKRCEVMLWTGFANPRENAVRAAYDNGSVNLNGGVFRWDEWNDSVGYVTGWSRRVGSMLQVYAGAANENDFEGFFTTMPGSYKHIDTTLERTGSPRILKPADIYIHFYSAETPRRLDSIHYLVKKWAFERPTAPVFCTTYVNAVRSAVDTARIERIQDGWRLSDWGGCRTARIDNEPRTVDFHRSEGVLGARRIGPSLYVHLSQPNARVILSKAPQPHVFVEEANCLLENVALTPGRVEFTAVAHNHRLVVVAGFKPGATVKLDVGGKKSEAAADANGRVTISLPDPGKTRIAAGH